MKQNAVYMKLSRLSGEEFDREFIDSMVKDHQQDIALYQQESQHSGPAADYAKQSLPKLREHLKMAEDLERGKQVAGGLHSPKMR
jgi:putative membrane protein